MLALVGANPDPACDLIFGPGAEKLWQSRWARNEYEKRVLTKATFHVDLVFTTPGNQNKYPGSNIKYMINANFSGSTCFEVEPEVQIVDDHPSILCR
jgi:hypothetical protein